MIESLTPPRAPFQIVVLGAGRVGTSFARALGRAGHHVLAELHRDDDPSVIERANVVVIAVPDDSLFEAAGVVARLAKPGTAVVHTCGLEGLAPLFDCGPLVAAVHPACPVASPGQSLDGITFGVTCPDDMRAWTESLVRDLGGIPWHVTDEERVLYHAALVMASNFAVTLAGEAAELLGDHTALVPLLRATIENVAVLGPDAALTGPIARGDAGTVRRHLVALPQNLVELYVVNARRTVARARAASRIDDEQARAIESALDEALVR